MKYITSNNLKKSLKLKNHMYRLLPVNDNEKSDVETYFCGECRSILHIKNSQPIICPNCGLKYKDYNSNGCLNEVNNKDISIDTYFGVYHIDDLIDSVTINKSFNDDGSIKDINITLLYHSYKISSDLQSKISWQHYDRILFNFETKQVYYTNKLALSKKVEFKHFKLHQEFVCGLSKFSKAIQSVIKEIYKAYHISWPYKTWSDATPANMQSPMIAFMCLKFPIMMNYAYPLWTSYKRRKNASYIVDMHISMIYWACNYDRVLKRALTSVTEQEYVERTNDIMCEMTCNSNNIVQSVKNPLYIVYARYMHQLGFNSFGSVERVVNFVSIEYSHQRNVSTWIWDMLCKRIHVRNKMYRRFLKIYSEGTLLDMLFSSAITEKYDNYFSGYSVKQDIDAFYTFLEQQFNDINFSENIDDIFHSII